MSLKYRDSQGTETPVAGLNGTSGELVPSVALYQSGYFAVESLPAGGYTNSDVITLQTPFPDTDYIITLDFAHSSLVAGVIQKTVSNFKVTIGNIDSNGGTGASVCYWKAYKLMTDEVHEADAAHISQNTANFAPAFSEVTSYAVGDYCTYNNVLYRCTTAHTAGVWVAGHFTAVTVNDAVRAYSVRRMRYYDSTSGAITSLASIKSAVLSVISECATGVSVLDFSSGAGQHSAVLVSKTSDTYFHFLYIPAGYEVPLYFSKYNSGEWTDTDLLTKLLFKNVVASSTDFADFKTKVAALA